MADSQPKCRRLVLDAGPLLSFSPLRGLAETFFTVPQVLAELKDARAREHFEELGLISGVNVEVRSPDPSSLAHVIQWAKKTGDYSVLSHADLCIIALTYALQQEDKRNEDLRKSEQENVPLTEETAVEETKIEQEASSSSQQLESAISEVTQKVEEASLEQTDTTETPDSEPKQPTENGDVSENLEREPLQVELVPIQTDRDETVDPPQESSDSEYEDAEVFEDPSDEDDGEGEWITPDNVALHKSRAMGIFPDDDVKGKAKANGEVVQSGCMTADFAMQNVIMQMGLSLVGLEGKRIERVKNWVLRCHACFKICKDNSKKFCPSCGNPTLLRASVTVSTPNASKSAPVMQVHLKPNFQYRIRGTKYSIPAPKPGSAKTGPGTGLILREDQIEYLRAKKRADGKKEREDQKLLKGVIAAAADGKTGNTGGSWMDPDWMPEIMSASAGGKGRTRRADGDMPQIGYGRKNPNEKRKKK